MSENSTLAHHFDSYAQQKESASLGMWVFISQEIMFFGGLFLAYTIYRWRFPEAFAYSSNELDIGLGLFNTIVLIGSSLTMALAVRNAALGEKNGTVRNLILTMLLGSVFLVVKGFEYAHKWQHHLIPGPNFQFSGPDPVHAQLFFVLYFSMTGLHALHMIVGLGILAWLTAQAAKGRFTPENHNYVEGVGLYWHFVDIIWIFLFPLLYLFGRHHLT
ncbi:MAG: cytochrome c oxidase subunit 3 family protein [Thermoanaerobaculia bacterium]|nr:Cytochrome c oxidase subunit 3 [Thermoanaerobaculia bacterium]MCK6685827.1 cytochrome c oxidase subunit 3 family protein [Thermoanaerobaculia bacterium]